MAAMVDVRITLGAKLALKALDDFMSGKPVDPFTEAAAFHVAQAGSFAAAARDQYGDIGTHAMIRAFLLALCDPAHPDLDYLRASPASGQAVRDANDELSRIVTGKAP